MPDVIVERETYILVSNSSVGLYPSPNVFPDPELYPGGADRVSNIVEGSMELDELLCDGELRFGQMCSDRFEVTVYDTEDISGKYIAVYQEDNGVFHELFTGIVDSAKLDRLGTDRQIIAYDLGYRRSRVNVADWYTNFWNTHSSATLKQFRDDLLYHMGIAYEDVVLINDNITLTKTVNITSIAFNEMLRMICELSCCFPHYNRDGELEFVMLNTEGTPTSLEGLYEGENSAFEDYTVQPFTGIQFYGNTSDLQYTEGSSANPYSIQENILLYNRTNAELHTIGAAMLDYISEITYKPSSVKMIISNVTYNLGDILSTEKGSFYVLHQTFNGSQLIEQLIEQQGSELQDQVGVETSISDLIKDTEMDEVDAQIGDINEDIGDINEEIEDINENVGNLEIHLNRTDEGLLAEVTNRTNADTTLQSSITQNANKIALKVSKGDVSSQLSVETDQITISSNRLVINSTNFQLDRNGNATIGGNSIVKSQIDVGNGAFTVNALGNTKVQSLAIKNSGHINFMRSNGGVGVDYIYVKGADGSLEARISSLYAYGGNIINSNNIGSQSVSYAKSAGSVSWRDVSGRPSIPSATDDLSVADYAGNGNAINFAGTSGGSRGATIKYVDSKSSSDIRLKVDVGDLQDISESYMKLKPKRFKFNPMVSENEEKNHQRYGLIAQDVQGIDNDLIVVRSTSSGTPEEKLCGKYQLNINYQDLHAWHIQMIQSQQRKIEELEQRISVLEGGEKC